MKEFLTDELTTIETAYKLSLSKEEYEKIKKILGRTPNFTELSMYSVMWSEHCSYKNSIFWLKKLPKEGPQILVEAGKENAGLVDIGNGLACVFKIESHNHPSAIEPYQGAATGVGGINRDIFTMGARPIAQLNSLRFGNLKKSKSKWLLKGVVKGIGDYGNSFGVPTVAGEIYFDDCYNENPLVNAMSVGIVDINNIISSIAKGEGNKVYIVGAATGKDGIHGATFASEDITESSAENLSSVQVGDPFYEKLLLEATLELANTGAIVGMQDMGAAGITCSTSEMSAKGKHGMNIYLDKVPLRQKNMQAFEILLSESQERMLVIVKKGREKEVERILDKWDLEYAIIGEVTNNKNLNFFMNGKLVAQVPAESLVLGGGAPVYIREYKEAEYYKKTFEFNITSIKEPDNLVEIAKYMCALPNIASKSWVYTQYDSMVGTVNMSTNFPSDAAIVNIKGTNNALALTVDCDSRYVYSDPEIGTSIAVAEASRNIVCSGAKPLAITNCLNFGNPYNPEVYWQFVSAIKGMIKACKIFETPVTGGNVSFYNQSNVEGKVIPIFPTPTIGMIGILENKANQCTLSFQNNGDLIYLIGECKNDINCSEYLYNYHKIKLSPPPYFDIYEEKKIQDAVLYFIKNNFIKSAHDCSEGGIFISLIESSLQYKKGFKIKTDANIRKDAFLFGESQSRIIVSVSPEKKNQFEDILNKKKIAFSLLGTVEENNILIDGENFGTINEYAYIYENSLSTLIEN